MNGMLPEKIQKRQETFFHIYFFPDMYLHAYSKASYQTPLNALCHLQELQIISGTSFS